MKWYEKFFRYSIYISYFLYIIIILGLSQTAPEYLDNLKDILKYFICSILLIRFNPFSNHKFTNFDKDIVFQCALYLLSTTAITSFAEDHFNQFNNYINK